MDTMSRKQHLVLGLIYILPVGSCISWTTLMILGFGRSSDFERGVWSVVFSMIAAVCLRAVVRHFNDATKEDV